MTTVTMFDRPRCGDRGRAMRLLAVTACCALATGPAVAHARSAAPAACQSVTTQARWTFINAPQFPSSDDSGGPSPVPFEAPESVGFDDPAEEAGFVVGAGNPGVLYVSDTRSLFASRDGGCHWSAVFSLPLSTTSPNAAALHYLGGDPYAQIQAFIAPAQVGSRVAPSAQRLYVAVEAQGVYAVLTSPDGGTTWTEVTPGAGANPTTGAVQVLAAAPASPDHVYLFAAASGGSALYSSDNAGQTWSGPTALPAGVGGDLGSYSGAVAVDPTNPRSLFTATTSATGAGVLLRSSDAGATWSTTSLPTPITWPFVDVTHQHGRPAAFLVSGNGQGWLSTDGGVSVQKLPAYQGWGSPPSNEPYPALVFGATAQQIVGIGGTSAGPAAFALVHGRWRMLSVAPLRLTGPRGFKWESGFFGRDASGAPRVYMGVQGANGGIGFASFNTRVCGRGSSQYLC